MDDTKDEPVCFSCTSLLLEPYIQCTDCEIQSDKGPVTLCLHCFSKGVEFEGHKSDHSYYLVVSKLFFSPSLGVVCFIMNNFLSAFGHCFSEPMV